VKLAEAHGIDAPVNRRLVTMIHELETKLRA
jgi:ketopantoate reductase